jgi:hypothetical protein
MALVQPEDEVFAASLDGGDAPAGQSAGELLWGGPVDTARPDQVDAGEAAAGDARRQILPDGLDLGQLRHDRNEARKTKN